MSPERDGTRNRREASFAETERSGAVPEEGVQVQFCGSPTVPRRTPPGPPGLTINTGFTWNAIQTPHSPRRQEMSRSNGTHREVDCETP